MNSKERVLTTFKYQEPDYVPVFDQLVVSKVASEILGRQAYTGGGEFSRALVESLINNDRDFIVGKYKEDVVELYANKLDMDIIPVWLCVPAKGTKSTVKKLDEYTYKSENLWGEGTYSISRFSESGEFFVIDSSLRSQDGVEVLRRWITKEKDSWLDTEAKIEDETVFEAIDYVRDKVGTEKAISVDQVLVIPLETAWLELILTNPELIEIYLDWQLKWCMAGAKAAKQHGADLILGGGDLANNQGPVYSPVLFRKLVLPRLKKLTEYCHQIGLPYIYRTDGNTRLLWQEMLIDSGVDGYHEIDYQAGMRINELKHQFGNKLVLMGNVDCAGVLVSGTKAEIYTQVKECIDTGKPGGGYVLSSSNSIHYSVPAENLWYMLDAAKKYGKYV